MKLTLFCFLIYLATSHATATNDGGMSLLLNLGSVFDLMLSQEFMLCGEIKLVPKRY